MKCRYLDELTGGRTPQGVRGLKSALCLLQLPSALSHPARGAWIEILNALYAGDIPQVAPRKGCVD